MRRAERLATVAPDANENASIFVCATWSEPSDVTVKRYNELWASTPRTIYGHAFRLEAAIAMSDMEIQRAMRPGRPVKSANVTLALKGVANLNLRKHDVARDCFSSGLKEGSAIVDFYDQRLQVSSSPQAAAHLTERYRLLCETGLGLTLRDEGRTDEARAIFQKLGSRPSPLVDDLRALAGERE
jgi:hypothetical protein